MKQLISIRDSLNLWSKKERPHIHFEILSCPSHYQDVYQLFRDFCKIQSLPSTMRLHISNRFNLPFERLEDNYSRKMYPYFHNGMYFTGKNSDIYDALIQFINTQ